MAKKKRKGRSKSASRNPQVQFRLGESVTEWLHDVARIRGLSENEVAKRLVIMARYEIDVQHFEQLSGLADALGGESCYPEACVMVYAAVQSTFSGRKPSDNERNDVIRETIKLHISFREQQRLEAEEQEQQRIHIHRSS